MKTRWLLCSFAALGILGYGGCTDGDGPTAPSGLDLNGAWTGTITDYGSGCAREGVTVAISQEGVSIRGSFQASCHGMLDLRGELNGDSVSGILYRAPDGSTIGQISGTASRASVRITTWGPQARDDDGPRSRPVVNVIDLVR